MFTGENFLFVGHLARSVIDCAGALVERCSWGVKKGVPDDTGYRNKDGREMNNMH